MLARRLRFLRDSQDLFALCIGSSGGVLKTYSGIFKNRLGYVPILVDVDSFKEKVEARLKQGKIAYELGFTGRLTSHRWYLIEEINWRLRSGAYPLQKSRRDEHSSEEMRQFLREVKQDRNKYFCPQEGIIQYNKIEDMVKADIVPLFEIYIPQARGWNYSSPNRTFLSIWSGLIPVDYGRFSDHRVNDVAVSCGSIDEIAKMMNEAKSKEMRELVAEYIETLERYNKDERGRCRALSAQIKRVSCCS